MGKIEKIVFNASNKAQEALSKVETLETKSSVTLNHQFADNTARDTYFTANPTELVDKLFIKVGTGYQQRISGVWKATSAVIIEQPIANQMLINDAGGFYTATNVEGALQEVGSELESLTTEQLNENHIIRATNNVKNEFTGGKLIERVKNKILQAVDVTSIANGTNVQYASINTSILNGVITTSSSTLSGFLVITPDGRKRSEVLATNLDAIGNEYAFTTTASSVRIAVPLGTWATLAQAQTFLSGTTINYQLATPIDVALPNPMSPNTIELTRLSELVNKKADVAQEAWITPTLLNGATGTIQYRKNNFGRLEFKGYITVISTTLTAFVLSVGYRTNTQGCPVYHDSGIGSVILTNTGDFKVNQLVKTYCDNISISI